MSTSLVYGALLGAAGGRRAREGELAALSRQPPRREARRAARQPPPKVGSGAAVGEPLGTPGEGAADGFLAAGSERESGSPKALGRFVATEGERPEEPVAGAARGYGTQLLLERNICSFGCLCNVEGGGTYLRVASSSYGLQSSRDVKWCEGTFTAPAPLRSGRFLLG